VGAGTSPPKAKKFDCLFVCLFLFVMLLNNRDSAIDFCIKAFELKNNFDIIRLGMLQLCTQVPFFFAPLVGATTEY